MGTVPADIAKVTERRRTLVAPCVHNTHIHIRTVSTKVAVFFRDERYVGESFRRLEVGLEPVDALHVRAWYRDIDLGLLETLHSRDAVASPENAAATAAMHERASLGPDPSPWSRP